MHHNQNHKQEEQRQGVQSIGSVLEELLAQYRARFPHLKLSTMVVRTPATINGRAASRLHP
jgi:hypothetical protein